MKKIKEQRRGREAKINAATNSNAYCVVRELLFEILIRKLLNNYFVVFYFFFLISYLVIVTYIMASHFSNHATNKYRNQRIRSEVKMKSKTRLLLFL